MNRIACIFLTLWSVGVSFLQTRSNGYNPNNSLQLNARRKTKDIPDEVASFTPGLDIPEEIKIQNAIYDMFLVERLSAPEKTDFGLFLPKVEGKDKKQIGIVLSVPKGYGLESEQGRVQSLEEICPTINVGDTVFIRDPWGIGPKDQNVGPRCFSFHKAVHITGVVRSLTTSNYSPPMP